MLTVKHVGMPEPPKDASHVESLELYTPHRYCNNNYNYYSNYYNCSNYYNNYYHYCYYYYYICWMLLM